MFNKMGKIVKIERRLDQDEILDEELELVTGGLTSNSIEICKACNRKIAVAGMDICSSCFREKNI